MDNFNLTVMQELHMRYTGISVSIDMLALLLCYRLLLCKSQDFFTHILTKYEKKEQKPSADMYYTLVTYITYCSS